MNLFLLYFCIFFDLFHCLLSLESRCISHGMLLSTLDNFRSFRFYFALSSILFMRLWPMQPLLQLLFDTQHHSSSDRAAAYDFSIQATAPFLLC